jgi:hypothetical protein
MAPRDRMAVNVSVEQQRLQAKTISGAGLGVGSPNRMRCVGPVFMASFSLWDRWGGLGWGRWRRRIVGRKRGVVPKVAS